MNESRFSQPEEPASRPEQHGVGPALPQMIASAQDIYQAARNRAIYDCQMDRLFNPDFYAQQGQ